MPEPTHVHVESGCRLTVKPPKPTTAAAQLIERRKENATAPAAESEQLALDAYTVALARYASRAWMLCGVAQ